MGEKTNRDAPAPDDISSEAYLSVDDDWRVAETNEAGGRLLGTGDEEATGRDLWSVVPGLTGTAFEDALRVAMAEDSPVAREADLPDRDGRFELRAAPDGDGLSVFVRDVTERHARRRSLEATAARFEALASTTDQALVTIDEDSVVRYASGAVSELFGYRPEELIGEPLTTVIPARYREAHEDGLKRYLETDERTLEWSWVEFPGLHRSGEEVPLGISFGETEIGAERRFTAVVRDISDRKQRERRREATLGALRTLYDVTTDPDRSLADKIDRTLELGCEYLDLPYGFVSRIEPDAPPDGRQTIVHARGDHPLLQPGETCPLSEAYCRRTIDTDGLLAIQDAIAAGWSEDPAYETFDLGAYVGGKLVVDDELYGTLCFAATDAREQPFTDPDRMLVRVMSKWVSYELERRRTHEELRRTNERLERFASAVSHDLRNPLTVAQGRLELARAIDDNEDLAASAAALDRMETMIEEALLLAREGEAANDPEPIALEALAEDAFGNVDTADAVLEVTATEPVRADPERLARMLENLFRNAVEHGGSDVTITVGDLPGGFYVADDGRGIPEEDRDRIFNHGFSTAEAGTGFGLAIVEEIATAHGWDVTLTESDAGGARFEVTGVARP